MTTYQRPRSGIRRTRLSGPAQLARFAAVSSVIATANMAIYLIVRTWWDPQPANVLAIVVSTAISTGLHRRFTFDGAAAQKWRIHAQTVGAIVCYLFSGAAALFLLDLAVHDSTPAHESAAVAAAGLATALGRFVVLRNWTFRPPAGPAHRRESS